MTLPAVVDPGFWLAILHEIDAVGGRGKAQSIASRIRQQYPGIAAGEFDEAADSGRNVFIQRFYFARLNLTAHGCVDVVGSGVWEITALGRSWLTEHWQGYGADYSNVKKPPRLQPRKQDRPRKPPDLFADVGIGRSPQPRSPNPDAPRLGSLIVEAARGGPKFVATEEYALAVAAYELGMYDEAISLLERAQTGTLGAEFQAKALGLSTVATEKRRARWEHGIADAKDRMRTILNGPLSFAELAEIRTLTQRIDEMIRHSAERGVVG